METGKGHSAKMLVSVVVDLKIKLQGEVGGLYAESSSSCCLHPLQNKDLVNLGAPGLRGFLKCKMLPETKGKPCGATFNLVFVKL